MTKAHAGLTNTGRIRPINEDAILVAPPLYAVADGLGGHQAGEVASRIAVETLHRQAPRRADPKALGRAVRAANAAVIEAAESGRGRAGMGTTLTAVMVEGLRIALAHVGDSRAYLLHGDGVLERISQDHSMVADMVRQGTLSEEESRYHPNRSVITRALGSDPNMHADVAEVTADEGDRLLICSDGLTAMLADDEIAMVLGSAPDADAGARALVDAANAAGGHDNISVVIVELSSAAAADPARAGGLRRWAARGAFVLLAAGIVAGGAYGAYRYARERAYVVAEEGRVALYRGVPGEFAGVRLSWPAEETTIPVDALPAVTQTRLVRGIRVEDVETGRALLVQYREQAEEASRTASPVRDPGERRTR
ncbi:MAG: Stp1/IreP family PP2C-type Ser/Thr phosphatase [Coriobacteriia bacterium]|nr:Stp1/IreP family PP2C-type Ser/Thr phosphatase [Coriobacteriia bacterium]